MAWLVPPKYLGSGCLAGLHLTVVCTCDAAIQGRSPCSGKIVHIPSKGFEFIILAHFSRKSSLHTYGRPCMNEVHGKNRLCPHTPGTRATYILRMTLITQVFVCSKYSRPVSARETDWYRMTSDLSFLFCMALGSFHKLFPSHPDRYACPNHVQ